MRFSWANLENPAHFSKIWHEYSRTRIWCEKGLEWFLTIGFSNIGFTNGKPYILYDTAKQADYSLLSVSRQKILIFFFQFDRIVKIL